MNTETKTILTQILYPGCSATALIELPENKKLAGHVVVMFPRKY